MATIRKRGKGYQIDYFDPNGKRIRRTFKKKKDAEAELGKRVSLIAEGRYLDVKKECTTTLKTLLEKYEENYKHQVSFKDGKIHYLENIEKYFGENTLLDNIRFVDMESYRNYLKGKLTVRNTVRKPSTVNREMVCLHHIFTKAIEWEMIEKNPFDRGRSLRIKEDNERTRYLSEDEISRLLDVCPQFLRDVVVCALNTGMRKSEILKLKWNQIRNGFIYLEAQMTKTKTARQVPINNDLNEMFKRIRKEIGLRPVSKETNEKCLEYVFTHRGKRMRAIHHPFKTALRKANIKDFRFHDLRHTAASYIVMRGGGLVSVQEILGHKNPAMSKRYSHLSPEFKKKAVGLLDGLTGGVCHKTVTSSEKANLAACN